MSATENIDAKLNALLTDSKFIKLASLRNRPNLFETISASHTEMWHSAFVKWLLDPGSHLGLGDFPLKRFLYAVMEVGTVVSDTSKPNLHIGELEDMDLTSMAFETEFKTPGLVNHKGESASIDVFGVSDEVKYFSASEAGYRGQLRLIIENKIKAKESKEQTESYYRWARRSSSDFDYDFFVFLTPDESQLPASENFIQLTYQSLCDDVLWPCWEHSELPDESRYLIEQYLLNLGRPLKGGRVMALSNIERCKLIYYRHQEVLDEIFTSVKGEVPQASSGDRKVRRSSTTLADLVSNEIIDPSKDYTLQGERKGKIYAATLENQGSKEEPKILIWVDGVAYDNVSPAAKAALEIQAVNGWEFWSVPGKGKLSELRDKLVELDSAKDATKE